MHKELCCEIIHVEGQTAPNVFNVICLLNIKAPEPSNFVLKEQVAPELRAAVNASL